DMFRANLVDKIIKEPLGGAHNFREKTYKTVKKQILESYKKLVEIEPRKRIQLRREKFSKMGMFKD
ncbi:MAG: acetyl-CoA carboxylase carboxyl transferase subunit alpha, partial [Flavobacteriaceae bacterium]|nr:acetyl-CoA carboxylase carboxyl transferase subunit alpha [Flavobacteriaceae bacterium]